MPTGIFIRTDEHKRNISRAKIGKSISWTKGKNNHLWKGKKVGYKGLHSWVRYWKGLPKNCEMCGKISFKKYDMNWANVDHKYRRNLDDFISLCSKCHGLHDSIKGLRDKQN